MFIMTSESFILFYFYFYLCIEQYKIGPDGDARTPGRWAPRRDTVRPYTLPELRFLTLSNTPYLS